MKRLCVGVGVICLIGAALAWSGPDAPRPEFDFQSEERNPVTHLRLNNAPDTFQFAIVSDRTGGHRAQVFSRAVRKLNLLQPEFVVSVGDLIEGGTKNKKKVHEEWREFQGYVAQLNMPFFYLPGNHDLSNQVMEDLWKEKFGRRYYSFVYRDVLFLMLNSEDPPGKQGQISEKQLNFIKETLQANPRPRWTLVFLHKPLWVSALRYNPENNGWVEVEKLLGGRPYTVFAGHIHRYRKYVRQGQNYYMLATTGGGSALRGTKVGEFDHIVWVTMKKDGPVLANVLLDGVLREDLKPIHTAEKGLRRSGVRPYPVTGKVLYEGKPVEGAFVVFFSLPAKGSSKYSGDATTDADGTFQLSSRMANDGAPPGEYVVLVMLRKPLLTPEGTFGPNHLPERYSNPFTSPLRANIKPGDNEIVLKLTKEAKGDN